MGRETLNTFGRVKYLMLLGIGGVVIALDQWTKFLIHTRFIVGESVPILSSFFSLTYVRNQGAAFGLLHKAPAYIREPLFLLIPFVAMGVILMIFRKLREDQKWTGIALSLISGGAIGNLIDRMRFKYVIDFLDFYWGEYHWPAFNVADSCIVVGVGIMFVLSFLQEAPAQSTKAL